MRLEMLNVRVFPDPLHQVDHGIFANIRCCAPERHRRGPPCAARHCRGPPCAALLGAAGAARRSDTLSTRWSVPAPRAGAYRRGGPRRPLRVGSPPSRPAMRGAPLSRPCAALLGAAGAARRSDTLSTRWSVPAPRAGAYRRGGPRRPLRVGSPPSRPAMRGAPLSRPAMRGAARRGWRCAPERYLEHPLECTGAARRSVPARRSAPAAARWIATVAARHARRATVPARHARRCSARQALRAGVYRASSNRHVT